MILATERLVLRKFTEEDWRAVMAYQQNPLYLRFSEWTERTVDQVRRFVEAFVAQQREIPRTRFQWALTLKDTGRLIGTCGIRRESIQASEAEIGFELDPACWGHGYATEAARALVQFGFSELHLHRIWAWCIADNAASIRVLEKLGMRREGRLREKHRFKDRWWDTLLYAILDREWQA
jgi:RimJ/RimL family protein N-acetyltransferase